MIRVLIADDSAAIRGFLRKTLSSDPAIEVVGAATNGVKAVEEYKSLKPDIVILDIEMPELNGLGALEQILKIDSSACVLMCSALTQDNAETTFKALELGAMDYIGKPSTTSLFNLPEDFNRSLLEKIHILSHSRKKPMTTIPINTTNTNTNIPRSPSILSGPFSLRPMPMLFHKADILAIGSSTGGLQALFDVLKPLQGRLTVPVVITQHMPASFTQMLGTHIEQKTGIPAHEAKEGDILVKGQIYVAPGGKHLEFVRHGDVVTARLSDAPPENFCRPAVDPMFRSLLNVYQRNILAVILTGMGSDGLNGARGLIEASNANMLIAQDEASSIVWGMPGAVAKAGLCHAVLPVSEIGKRIALYL